MAHLQFLVKPVSSLCNLECEYCFYLDLATHQHDKPSKMTREVLSLLMERAAEYFIQEPIGKDDTEVTANGAATADNGSDLKIMDGEHSVSFLFQGGEPTLAGVEFFKAVIEEQQRAFAKFNGRVPVFNSIQTNACRLSKELVSLLTANHFFFGVSLDGPAHVHDAMRFYKNGRGSFDEVMKGIELLRRYHAEFNILCVVTDIVVKHIAEVYAFYKDHGFYNIQFIACLDAFAAMPPHPCTTDPKSSAIPFKAVEQAEHYHDCSCASNSSSYAADHAPHSCGCADNATALRVASNTPASCASNAAKTASGVSDGKRFLSDEAYSEFLVKVFDLFYDDLINKGEYVSIRHIENYIALLLNMEINACNMTGVCRIQNVIEASGKVYPCDFYAHDDFVLGDLKDNTLAEIMNCQKAQQFVNTSRIENGSCLKCDYFKLCRGGCVRERENNVNIRCAAFKNFFAARLPKLQHAAAILSGMQG